MFMSYVSGYLIVDYPDGSKRKVTVLSFEDLPQSLFDLSGLNCRITFCYVTDEHKGVSGSWSNVVTLKKRVTFKQEIE